MFNKGYLKVRYFPTVTLYVQQTSLHSEWSPRYPLQFPRHALGNRAVCWVADHFLCPSVRCVFYNERGRSGEVTVRACPVRPFAFHVLSLEISICFYPFLFLSITPVYSLCSYDSPLSYLPCHTFLPLSARIYTRVYLALHVSSPFKLSLVP